MSLVLPRQAVPASVRARRLFASAVGWDALCLGALALFAWAIVVWRSDALPLQLWDESRNANDALEAALNGRWFTPTFGGVPDHWNTKPPLLIWLMAAGLKLGLPPLVALRLPSWGAAFATLGLVWASVRLGLKDRVAAAMAGVLLLSSLIYVGPHAARTGDFDALESLFVAGYVLCGWAALEGGRHRIGWLAATAVFAVLAVMTKGVAGLLAAPGLAVFALFRGRALLAALKDVRTWLLAAAALGICAGYYLLRDHLDPGYIRAVLANEIGGRFSAVSENHKHGPGYYLSVLAVGFEPGLPLLASVAATFFRGDVRRRTLVLATLLSGLSLLAVLSAAQSKLDWYATPIIPLFSIAAGVGGADLLAWICRKGPWSRRVSRGMAGSGLVVAAVLALVMNQTATTSTHGDLDGPQFDYARLFARLEAAPPPQPVIVVDSGFFNSAGFKDYNPILRFYALREAQRGLPVEVRRLGEAAPAGRDVATCDPDALDDLKDGYRLAVRLSEGPCTMARIIAPAP
jgi:4-amino-4-deoxy-L-arabinose transferase-like glycosyltransferase